MPWSALRVIRAAAIAAMLATFTNYAPIPGVCNSANRDGTKVTSGRIDIAHLGVITPLLPPSW